METFWGLENIPAHFGPSAVTIGKFDGVHVGHRQILTQLTQISQDHNLVSTVVTFDRHPMALLNPEDMPADIISLEERLDLISQAGVQVCVVLTFEEHLSKLSPEEFVKDILSQSLNARVVLAGKDFRFGADAVGDISTLTTLGKEHGFDVVLIEDVSLSGGERVSSSLIREAMAQGDMARVKTFLGRYPRVIGEVVHGEKRGRAMGFPTANLSPDATGLIPADGIYAGWFYNKGKKHPCAISVGTNPTFDNVTRRTVEAYVLDQDFDVYGHHVEVEFVEHLRGMVAYESVDALIEQMNRDVENTRKSLGLERA